MEEKKRVRPTWAQVRELEALVGSLREELRLSQRELSLSGNGHDALVEESASMSAELVSLRRQLDEQVEATSAQVQECYAWREKYREAEKELVRLRGRGFWARVFNK